VNSVPDYLLGGGSCKNYFEFRIPSHFYDFKSRFYHIGPTLTLPYIAASNTTDDVTSKDTQYLIQNKSIYSYLSPNSTWLVTS